MVEKHDTKNTLTPIIKKSEDEFNEGLRLLLKQREESKLNELAAWPGELSDPDKALTTEGLSKALSEKNKKLLEELKQRFEDEEIDLDTISKKAK